MNRRGNRGSVLSMRPVEVGGVRLELESPEAGRYLAPILIVPGLFQSAVCWRGVTSMLAHRGWEVYVLPRTGRTPSAGWQDAVEAVSAAASALADRVVLFGSDIGAALALEACSRADVLALALFAPTLPGDAGRRYLDALGLLGRWRRRSSPLVAPPPRLRKRLWQQADAEDEPAGLIEDLIAGPVFSPPAKHPPAIVFETQGDPLSGGRTPIVSEPYAKTSDTRVEGRWWPSLGWEAVSNEVHRFLVLTLADRVVEFPDEVLG